MVLDLFKNESTDIQNEAKMFLSFFYTNMTNGIKYKDLTPTGDYKIPFALSVLEKQHQLKVKKVCKILNVEIVKDKHEYIIFPIKLYKRLGLENKLKSLNKDFE